MLQATTAGSGVGVGGASVVALGGEHAATSKASAAVDFNKMRMRTPWDVF
jgi:hypothetical protein